VRIVLWRHGQTDWNIESRFQGHSDIPLNAVGHYQAAHAAKILAGMNPVKIIASDLIRAQQTAQAALQAGIPLFDLEGLLKFPNYSPAIIEQLRPFVVILPALTTINVNTAPPEVLMAAISGLSRGAANSFVQQRATSPFKSIDEITGLLNKVGGAQGVAIDAGLVGVKSQFWLANTEIRLGRGIFVSSALIQRSPTALPGGNFTQVIWSRTGKMAAD